MENSVLHLKNVSKYLFEINVLQCINLEIPKGSIYGIIENNNPGKSALFRCVIGLEKLNKGAIFGGEKILYSNSACLHEIRKKIGIVFQQLNLFTSRTIEKNISYSIEVYGVPLQKQKYRLEETIRRDYFTNGTKKKKEKNIRVN